MTIAETLYTLGPGWRIYLDAIAFCFGACMGSFLNVCIYRIPREESVIVPGSHCPRCNTPIAWHDNIPLVSYCALKARCRHCHGRISPRYVLVEALVAVLFLLVWLKFGPLESTRPLGLAPVATLWLVPIYWLAVFGLALGTFVDFEHMIIPDRVTLGGTALGLLFGVLAPALHVQETRLGGLGAAAVGAGVGGGLLYGIAVLGRLIFRKDAMGMGDVKLMAAIGAFLGWVAVIFTLMLSSLLGAAAGLAMVALGRKEMQSRIPYGPYLALGALVWLLWGPALLRLYLNWLIPPA